MSQSEIDQIVAAVAESRRYRHVAPSLITRLATEELPKSKNPADAEKRTKRRLHQIFGAYASPLPYDRLLSRLDDTQGDPELFKKVSSQILSQHASTRERLDDLQAGFYDQIFEITGRPLKVLDLACGFNPLTLPWMNLSPSAFYIATDIDAEMVRFIDRFLALAPVHGEARLVDLIEQTPTTHADIAYLFKALPCLRHQTDDLLRILRAINAPWLVISFPTKSLGGRSKNMRQTYRTMLHDLLKETDWQSHELDFPSELVFVVNKGKDGHSGVKRCNWGVNRRNSGGIPRNSGVNAHN
jgi:16S rRNA (guanine(1405)-N(7))-methyltransferase